MVTSAHMKSMANTNPRERAHISLPTWFDETKTAHTTRLLSLLEQQEGSGWEIDEIDTTARQAHVSRSVQGADIIEVALASDVSQADGDRVSVRMSELHPGYAMTSFRPKDARATLARMSPELVRAREAVAVAMSVKPWDIVISGDNTHGYDVRLPSSYTPSRHDKRLAEAAETAIGQPGWWVKINAKTLTGRIAPGKRPTLPILAHYPDHKPYRDLRDQMRLPIGVSMEYGAEKSREISLDLWDNAGVLIVGTPGSGKSVTINALICGALERDWDIGIIDVPHKAGDYAWCEGYVHENWFGARSLEESVATTGLVYAVRDERKRLLAQYGVEKWNDLPDDVRPAPLLLVCDELTGLFFADKPPTGVSKDNPDYIEAANKKIMTVRLEATIRRIALELRFVGVRLLLATQQAQGNTGISVPLKMALPNRILLGSKPDRRAYGHAFQAPDDAPAIPSVFVENEKMGKGVGIAEIEGEGFVIFKSYFDTGKTYRQRFATQGLHTTINPYPTGRQIRDMMPVLLDDPDDADRPFTRFDEGGFGQTDDVEPPLRGAARAAHQLRVAADQYTAQNGDKNVPHHQ